MVMITCDMGDVSGRIRKGEVLRGKNYVNSMLASGPRRV